MLWPELNRTWSSVDCDCARSGAAASAAAAISNLQSAISLRLTLSGGGRRLLDPFAGVELLLVLVVAHVVPGDPREPHLVDGALAAADPVARVGIALRGRIVV